MDFMEKIEVREVQTNSVVQTLKATNLPLLLWGCGDVAYRVYLYSQTHRIQISDVFVNIDRKSVSPIFNEFTVIDLNEACKKYQSFNILVGHVQGYFTGERLKKENTHINEVYSFDMCEFMPFGPIEYGYINDNKELFEWTYNELSDELSKNSYLTFLNGKTNQSSKGFLPYVCNNTYFPQDIIKLSSDEIFIDCGAYNGDTVKRFIVELERQSVSDYRMIYAFEPDKDNFVKLYDFSKKYLNFNCINKGVWNEQATLPFVQEGTESSAISDRGKGIIKVDTIDNVLSPYLITHELADGKYPMLIKMDIEGAELNALKGTSKSY